MVDVQKLADEMGVYIVKDDGGDAFWYADRPEFDVSCKRWIATDYYGELPDIVAESISDWKVLYSPRKQAVLTCPAPSVDEIANALHMEYDKKKEVVAAVYSDNATELFSLVNWCITNGWALFGEPMKEGNRFVQFVKRGGN